MILKEARKNYYDNSGLLSASNRQLCFAGIAIIWIFSIESDSGAHSLDKSFMFPLFLLAASLALDLLQYAVASASWAIFCRNKEKEGIGEEQEFPGAPKEINWTPVLCLWLKTFCTLIGYVALLFILYNDGFFGSQ